MLIEAAISLEETQTVAQRLKVVQVDRFAAAGPPAAIKMPLQPVALEVTAAAVVAEGMIVAAELAVKAAMEHCIGKSYDLSFC